jgi:hypothetical protein
VPRSLRRASKRPKQPNPRQLQQPRAHRQQLKQPVRLRLRNLPQPRLLAEQPNLPLRPRLLRKFWLSSLRSLLPKSPGEDFCCTDVDRMTKEIQMTKPKKTSDPAFRHLSFVINSSFVIRISSFPKTATCRSQLRSPFQKLGA